MKIERAGKGTVMAIQVGKRPPLLRVYRIATDIVPRWGFKKNVYQEVLRPFGVGKTIGLAANVGAWCVSLQWRKL